MKHSLFKGKSTRTKILTALTLVVILVLFVLNLLMKLAVIEGQFYLDMTPEGFYTMTPLMEDTCAEILDSRDSEGGVREVEIIFCRDPDKLIASTSTRMTYFMALQLRNRFEGVTVKTVTVAIDPSAVSMFRTTSRREITGNDMIVSYNGRYKITDITTFWTDEAFSYDGEYRMASILASLTARDFPVAYFVSDYGTTYYDPENPDSEMSIKTAELADLITERGFRIKTLPISEVDRIPEDCALLIINAPTLDFEASADDFDRYDYVSDTEKIDRYLASHEGAVIVTKAHGVKLPNFELFISEWGIGFGDGIVRDEENALGGEGSDSSVYTGVYDIDSIGGAYYKDYASLSTSPEMVFMNSGYVYSTYPDEMISEPGGYNAEKIYSLFINTSDSAVAYEDENGKIPITKPGTKALAAVTTRTFLDPDTSEKTYSYLFCANSEDFFSNELLSNGSYANRGIMASVISSIGRVDRYASIDLGGHSFNSGSYGGKQTHSTTLTEEDKNIYSPDASKIIGVNRAFTKEHAVVYSVIIFIPPVVLIAVGAVIFIKRKNL